MIGPGITAGFVRNRKRAMEVECDLVISVAANAYDLSFEGGLRVCANACVLDHPRKSAAAAEHAAEAEEPAKTC